MPYKLSNNTLQVYKQCPTCFWRDINAGEKLPRDSFPTLLSRMDELTKQHFDYFRKLQTLPPELSGLGDVHLFDLEHLLSKWRDERYGGLKWQDCDGNVLRGSVDEILYTNDGDLIVLDFKSRGSRLAGFPDRGQLQLEIYNLLLRKQGFSTEDFAYLLVLYPTAFNLDGTVFFSSQPVKVPVEVERAEKTFYDALKLLEGPRPELNKNCKYCNWNIVKQKK